MVVWILTIRSLIVFCMVDGSVDIDFTFVMIVFCMVDGSVDIDYTFVMIAFCMVDGCG